MNRKVELTKKKRLLAEQKRQERLEAIKVNKELINAIDKLYGLINGQESYDFTKLEKQLEQIDKSLDLTKHFKNLERSIATNSPHKTTLKTKITDFSKLLDAVKNNKPIDQRVDISKLEKAVINIEQYIRDNSEPSDQGAENYQPFRRVIKTGNRFIFDDNYYNNGGGGAAVQESLISNNRVKVDVGTNINVGEVEVKNDSGNPVPISGTVTATPSGTQNVDVVANTVGLATSAKQDTAQTTLDAIKTAVETIDTASLDAFGALRVSQKETLLEFQQVYKLDTRKIEYGATGTGVSATFDSDTRMAVLSCTSGTGTSFGQTYEYAPYQPGKSHLAEMTFLIGTAVASAVVDVGLFDADNGIFFRQNGTSGLQVVRRTKTSGSVVDNTVSQSSWNLDKLDGTGVSGITLDITKAQILIIDLQYLGMGRVRIGFVINGKVYYCHEFLNANNLTVPYMQTASLPIQMLITATSTGSTKTSYLKCGAVHSEGGLQAIQNFHLSTPSVARTAGSGARTHVMSIRPKTTFNSITNRKKFIIDSVNINVTGNNPIFWELCTGVTFTGTPSYADLNTTYSAFEYDTAGVYSTMGGWVIASGYVAASNQSKGSIGANVPITSPTTLDRAGAVRNNGTLTLLVSGIGSTSAMQASINYSEIH